MLLSVDLNYYRPPSATAVALALGGMVHLGVLVLASHIYPFDRLSYFGQAMQYLCENHEVQALLCSLSLVSCRADLLAPILTSYLPQRVSSKAFSMAHALCMSAKRFMRTMSAPNLGSALAPAGLLTLCSYVCVYAYAFVCGCARVCVRGARVRISIHTCCSVLCALSLFLFDSYQSVF
jgi:hypothetical protein